MTTRAWSRPGRSSASASPQGFFATYDPTTAEGNRVTGMWLNGKAIESATAYSVTVNSFLASGGDNFRAFNAGTGKRDTGKVDLQAMVDYMAAKAATDAARGRTRSSARSASPGPPPLRASTGSAQQVEPQASPRWR